MMSLPAQTTPLEVTRPLTRFIVQSRFADLPPDARHAGVRAFHNSLGCMLGGCGEEVVLRAASAMERFSGPPQATVIGSGKRLDAPSAAALNTMANFVHSYNDTHLATVAHPAGAPTAAVLALAEAQRVTGEDAVLALVLGIEIACRLANVIAAPPAQCHVGLSTHGVTNVIGTAVAAGKLLGLDEDRMVWAIGLAVTQAAGLRTAHGSMASKLIGGMAARAGLMSAFLAAEGFTCGERPIEGPKGFADVFGQPAHLPHALERLGTHYEMTLDAFKPFPAGIVNHAAADACIRLATSENLDPAQVARVDLAVHPMTLKLCDRAQPADRMQALVSVQHWAAVALLYRRAGLREGANACVRDPAVAAMRARIAVRADAALGSDAAAVAVTLADGRTLAYRLEHCQGSEARPMTDAELDEKFRGQAALVLPAAAIEPLIADCWRLPGLPDLGAFINRHFAGA